MCIALTGNYAFFNLLTAALCLFLLDDAARIRDRALGRERIVEHVVFDLAALHAAVAIDLVEPRLRAEARRRTDRRHRAGHRLRGYR